jgi:lysophospholipase L1-like esterase
VVLTLLLIEAGVRLLLPPALWWYHDASKDWRVDPELGWVNRPSLDITSRSDQGWLIRFRTNGDGLTPAAAEQRRKPGIARILIVGDSTVLGRAVPEEKRIHAFLETILSGSGRRVEVINAGVEGHATDQALLRMKQLVPLYRPDLVIYGLCANDFGGNKAAVAHGYSKPRFLLEEERLVLIPPVPQMGRAEQFVKGPRRLVQAFALYRLVRPRLLVLRARLGGWEHQNLIGIGSDLYHDSEALAGLDWPLLTMLLREMEATARRGNARFVFYAHPSLEEVWEPYIRDTELRLGLQPGRYDRYALERRLRSISGENSIPFCPLIDDFVAHRSLGPFHLLPRDSHCNPAGYQLTAEVLARCIDPIEFGTAGRVD